MGPPPIFSVVQEPQHPSLLPGCRCTQFGMDISFNIVVAIEILFLMTQFLLIIYVSVAFELLGIVGLLFLAVGVWSVLRLKLAEREENYNLLNMYIVWKSIVILSQSGAVLAAILAFPALSSPKVQAALADHHFKHMEQLLFGAAALGLVIVVMGILALIFVARSRVYFQEKSSYNAMLRARGSENTTYTSLPGCSVGVSVFSPNATPSLHAASVIAPPPSYEDSTQTDEKKRIIEPMKFTVIQAEKI